MNPSNFAPMKKTSSILLQVAIWAGIWSIFAFSGNTEDYLPRYYLVITLRVLEFAFFYNLAYYWLLPLFFTGRKRTFYMLVPMLFAAHMGFSLAVDLTLAKPEKMFAHKQEQSEGQVDKGKPWSWLILPPLFFGTMLFGVAAGWRGFAEFERKRLSEEEANRRRLEAEVALLKAQINPHFLLNTLNNLYGISITEPQKTPDALLMLSDMVRYILYDCARPTVPLHQDIAFVKNYLALQKLRLPPNVQLRIAIPEQLPALQIEPMLLITFIENAFKYGVTTRQPCEIDIAIHVDGSQLDLHVDNQVFDNEHNGPENHGGIGLSNVRKRLEHTYAGHYELKITRQHDRHTVHLRLNLAIHDSHSRR